MMNAMKRLVFPLIFLISISLASATYISITTTASSGTIFHNSTILSVLLQQGGDEAAYDVSVFPLLPEGFSYTGALSMQRLDPEKSIQGNFTVYLNGETTLGEYPVVIQTIYHDANMYPFSTISPYLLTYKEKYLSDVYGTISSLEITKDGSDVTTLTLRNTGSKQHQVKVKLYTPKELKCDVQSRTIPIGSQEEKKITYKISSFGALVGSNYIILASLEYNDSGHHYTSFARGMVKIVEKKQNLNLLWLLTALFVVLLLVFVYFKIKGAKVEKK